MTETFLKGSENISELFKTTAHTSQAFLKLPQPQKVTPQNNPETKFASDHTVTTKCYSDPLEEFALHADSINQFGTGVLPCSTSPPELINGRERATSETQNNGVSLVQGAQNIDKQPQSSSEGPLVSAIQNQPNQNVHQGLSALNAARKLSLFGHQANNHHHPQISTISSAFQSNQSQSSLMSSSNTQQQPYPIGIQRHPSTVDVDMCDESDYFKKENVEKAAQQTNPF